tara:strand:- start:983 stop:1453 length:471 start_codon:yes stop_codon:yes gene_type:complete
MESTIKKTWHSGTHGELEHKYLFEALSERGEELENLGWGYDFWNSGGNTMLVMLWDLSAEGWGYVLSGDDQESSDQRIEEYPIMSLFRPDGESDTDIQLRSDEIWDKDYKYKINTQYASLEDGAINDGQAIRTKESINQYVNEVIEFLTHAYRRLT